MILTKSGKMGFWFKFPLGQKGGRWSVRSIEAVLLLIGVPHVARFKELAGVGLLQQLLCVKYFACTKFHSLG